MTPEQWKRAKLVLEGARRHSASDRSQYVSIACADDPELLREVESLLDLSSTPSDRHPDATATPARTEWEHLTILAEVGRGAFGRVYRAWDPALEQEVALKLIKVDARGAEFAESVFHEARLLARLDHPNVVNVLGARRVGAEVGIWMEFISGPTLADAVEREGPMSAAAAAAAGVAICDALAAVHGTGVLHRDIKARNVMRDPAGRVVLMDFGAGAERRKLPPGEMAGTPLYMAPELVKGAGASAASDIYSVGVLLFHLVTGEYPVSGSTIYELESAHDRDERVRLAERRPDLPEAFVEAVDRALSPDPEARFKRAIDFRDALADVAALLTAPVAVPAPAERWPWIAGLALAGTVLAVTFLGFLTSAAFDLTLGRTGQFSNESPLDWPVWGVRALIAPVVYMTVVLLLWMLVRWLIVSVAALLRRLRPRRVHAGATPVARLIPRQPATVVRLAAIAGTLGLIGTWWQFGDLIEAVTVKIATAEPGALTPLAPGNDVERVLYRRALEATMLVIGLGLHRAYKMARRTGARIDLPSAAWAIGIGVIALLMTVIPYRVAQHNDQFVRARLNGMRCYILGQDGRQLLLYCPDSAGAHNFTVGAGDPGLQVEGIFESIFTPASQAAPSPTPQR